MTGTTHYLVRRLIQYLFVLLIISFLSFMLTRLMPGSPGFPPSDPNIPQATIDALNRSYGLDDPIPAQYVTWLSHVLQGDLGRSYINQQPVADKIAERLPATLTLNLATVLIGLLGIPMGILAAVRRGSLFDRGLAIFNALGNSLPHWWIGLLILLFFAGPTGLLPLGGIGKEHDLLDRAWHLILPATIAALGDWILFSRYLRSSILEVIHLDYIRSAYAKGLTSRAVLWRHAFRNALIPVVPFFVFSVAGLVSGSVLYENTFSWPGVGRLAVQAAFQRDYPVVLGLTLLGSLLTALGLIAVDVFYVVVDPRIRYGAGE